MANPDLDALNKAVKSAILPLEQQIRSLIACVSALKEEISVLKSVSVPKQSATLQTAAQAAVLQQHPANPSTAVTTAAQSVKPAVSEHDSRQTKRNTPNAVSTKARAQLQPKKRASLPLKSIATPNHETPQAAPSPPVTAPSNSVIPNATSKLSSPNPLIMQHDDNDSWKTVSHKKRRPKARITVGTGTPDNEIQTVEQLKYIQAWAFKPETTEANIHTFLNKVAKSNDYFVEKRVIKSTRHASFIIGFPEGLYETFSDASVWPPRVRFVDWFLHRPRVDQRGEQLTERRADSPLAAPTDHAAANLAKMP